MIAPTTPEGGFSSPDRTRFDEKLRSKVLDQLCRNVRLDQNFDFGVGDFSGTSAGVSRYLAPRIDNKLTVVDEERVRAAWGHDFGKDFDGVPGGFGAGIYLSGGIEGRSMVVRPIDSVDTCAELDRLANVFDIKTVLPFTPDRISKMQVGELWRVPLVLSYSQGLSLSDVLGGDASVSVSFGRSESGAASLTLYRLSDDQTRFRFRIDHVVIKNAGARLSVSIPAVAFAADAHNILLQFVEREIARELSQYTSLWLGAAAARSDGKRVMLEFVADPRDPRQALALSKALKGDFVELVRMGLRMSTLRVNDDSTREAYERLRREHATALGEPTYAAISEYIAKTRSFSLNIPFLIQHNASSLFGSDKVTRLNGATGEFRYYRADKSRSNEYFNVPWVGPLVKSNKQRNAEVVTFAEPGQKHGEPFIVYIHNEGYLRQPASAVRRSISDVNSILTMAGAMRGAASGRLAVPLASLPPAPPPPEPPQDGTAPDGEPAEYKGYFAMTMVINQKGVREALGASAEQVLKAFAAVVGADDRETAQWLAAHGRFEKGELIYDRAAARERFAPPPGSEDYDRTLDLADFSRRVADLVADIATARDAKSSEEQAEAVAKLMAGRGKGDLAHEVVLGVLIQFIDPLDLRGDFVSTINSTARHGKNYGAHYVLENGREEVPLLKDAGETKGRFAEPSILVD
ncbi:MAG: hypothetical protein A2V88_10435 [Elusimicrobia bacterium RBG_16_66_12]|nr:MAG: hypothetical protein A2V88_10435 [Elusimicrobia bacterium RBG_16_66_12]